MARRHVVSALAKSGLTLKEAVRLPERDVLRLRHVGHSGLAEIRSAAPRVGFHSRLTVEECRGAYLRCTEEEFRMVPLEILGVCRGIMIAAPTGVVYFAEVRRRDA